MNINPDDPKWTAYVLDELSDAERAQVEKELESSAAAREIVEEIRLATSLLREELVKEQHVILSAEQKRTISAAAAPRQRMRPVFRWATAAASVAAGLLIVATLSIPSLLRSRQAASVALNMPAHLPAEERTPGATGGPVKREQAAVPSREKEESAPKALQAPPAVQEGARQEKDQALQIQVGQVDAEVRQQQFKQTRDLLDASRLSANAFAEKKDADMAPPPAAAAPTPAAADALRSRFNTEAYDFISDNPFIRVAQDPLATFSTDVDTASYSNVRRFLTMNQLPPKDAVRIEEMVNYFAYDYPSPTGRHPIAAYTEVAAAPWKPDHRLVRIAIKAREIDVTKRPPSNLVFLIDVSGSMAPPDRLPMLKSAMKLMVERLGEGDHVAIVTYAGASGLHLRSTNGERKDIINSAIDNLGAGGSTNGASGIVLAYDTAISNFIRGGVNRVVLATDGDFNVGVTNQGDLTRLIEQKAKSGVFLSVLGFGMGNYKDSTLEKLADQGNGNYAYIDTLNEARKVLVDEMSSTLMTVAKDVKIQVEFNRAEVNAYRLIGYENRALRHEDFNDDSKDAGEMGAGHAVTALFEIVPRGVEAQITRVDPLKYQTAEVAARNAPRGEILNLKIRYQEPEGNSSQLIETPVLDRGASFANASGDFRFAAAVASFGMILRDSPHKGQSTIDAVVDMAEKSRGADRNGYREEFLQLVRKVRALRGIQ